MDLKAKLLENKVPEAEIKKFLAYIAGEKNAEAKKEKKPVSGNSDLQLYTMFIKFWNMGLTIDGINVVITGNNMAMVTFHGLKNIVLKTYPETEIDMGLVREGDTFNLAKESGSVIYSHNVADPFGNAEIQGAYVVMKNKRGEFIETLNKHDYDSMKNASKQGYLWDKWGSEFWLKSVMKRACKRHFYDVVADIDKVDNEVYGADLEEAIDVTNDAIKAINGAKTEDELSDIVLNLPVDIQKQVTKESSAKMKELQGNGTTGA